MTQPVLSPNFLRDFRNLIIRVNELENKVNSAAQVDVGPIAAQGGRPDPDTGNVGVLWIVSNGTTRQLTISNGTDWENVAPPVTN